MKPILIFILATSTLYAQKGQMEILGALGGHTTVLTVGSDGTGISLQRNWPTIGLNQYRDENNVQRFIGNAYAGSIFLSAVDGGIYFNQFGQGQADGLINTSSTPFYIDGMGTVVIEKGLELGPNARISKPNSGGNLLARNYGIVQAHGNSHSGTANFTTSFMTDQGYILNWGIQVFLTLS